MMQYRERISKQVNKVLHKTTNPISYCTCKCIQHFLSLKIPYVNRNDKAIGLSLTQCIFKIPYSHLYI